MSERVELAPLRAAVQQAVRGLGSEYRAAAAAGVTRGTVRGWLGRPRSGRPHSALTASRARLRVLALVAGPSGERLGRFLEIAP